MSLWPALLIFGAGVVTGMALAFLIAVLYNLEERTADGETDPYQSRPRKRRSQDTDNWRH